MKKTVFLWFVLFLLCNALEIVGQDCTVIDGQIIDAESNEPLAFAAVGTSDNRIGTVTNYDGKFTLKLLKSMNYDTLVVSCLGFEHKKLVINKIAGNQTIVRLKPLIYFVKEITVRPDAATALLKDALAKIPENYPDKPMNITAFYREVIADNGKPIQFIEAVLGIYKASYTDRKDKDLQRIIKGRQRKDLHTSRLWDYMYFISGTYEMLESDFVKYPTRFVNVPQTRINFLEESDFKYFDYTLTENKSYEGRPMYVIEFQPKTKYKRAVFSGKFCIDKQTLAFVSMEYAISDNRLDYLSLLTSSTRLSLDAVDVTTKTVDYYCLVNYKPYGDRWCLANVKMNYQFVIYSGRENFFSNISNSLDWVVTDIDTAHVQCFPAREQIRLRQSLTEQLGEPDESFWENYNTIKLEDNERVRKGK